MSLQRENTRVLLKSDDASWYWVSIVDAGGGLVTLEVDTTPEASVPVGADEYAVLTSDDGNKYRWTLESETVESVLFVSSVFTISPDQGEDSLSSIGILYGSTWYYVTLETISVEGTDFTTAILTADADPSFGGSGGGGGGRGKPVRAHIVIDGRKWPTKNISLTGFRSPSGIISMNRKSAPLRFVKL